MGFVRGGVHKRSVEGKGMGAREGGRYESYVA